MKDFLDLIKELNESDIDWFFQAGIEQQVIANTVIVQEQTFPDAIYIVLKGLVGLRIEALGEGVLKRLGPGELIGEMSLIENAPAVATVYAIETTLLLAVPRQKLNEKLQEDAGFAARLYRAFAIIISQRLRAEMGSLGLMYKDKPLIEERVKSQWDSLHVLVDQMKELFEKIDRYALSHDGEISEELENEFMKSFHDFCVYINDKIGNASVEHAAVNEELGLRVKREMLPFILMTKTAERFYSKPRGYAGDFMTIEQIYQNKPDGAGRIGPLLDACFLNEPAAKAVRNRRSILKEEILAAIQANADKSETRITSLACGPAAELFDVYAQLEDKSTLRSTLIDIDLYALAFVGDKRDGLRLKRYMNLVNANLVYLATGRQNIDLKNQDLVYSIGLIDYFNDRFVVELLNYLYMIAKPGGKVILGNFHPNNVDRALMDYVLDWKLIYRNEDDMNQLFQTSKFKRPCAEIRFEPELVNMFAICVKE